MEENTTQMITKNKKKHIKRGPVNKNNKKVQD